MTLFRRSTVCPWGACVLLTLAAFFHAHPSERLLGQGDAASYLFSGTAFAKGQSFGPHQALLNDMPALVRECAVVTRAPLGLRDASSTLRQRPFYLEWQLGDSVPGDLVPRFPPGYSFVLALGYRIAGLRGALVTNAFLMFVAGLLVLYLAQAWAGPLAGFFAAGLWAFLPTNVWISNTTLAEPLVLLLGLGAVAAWVRADQSSNPIWPLLMGVCLGLAPAVKLDAIPWLMVPVAFAWLRRREGFWRAFLPVFSLVPCLFFAGFVLLRAGSGYTRESMATMLTQPAVKLGLLVLMLGGLGVVLISRRLRVFERRESPASSTQEEGKFSFYARWLGFVGLVGGFAFFYFIRSRWAGSDRIFWAPMGQTVASLRELSLVRLGWYLPPLALWTALVSASAMIFWAKPVWVRVFAGVGVAVFLLLAYDHVNFPAQPFATRRFLPQAVPVLVVALAGAGAWAGSLFGRQRLWTSVGGLVVAYAIVHGACVNAKMATRADAEGLIDKLGKVAECVGPKGLVVLRPSSPLMEMAPLLAFGLGQDVLTFRIRSGAHRKAIVEYLAGLEKAGRDVWLWTDGADDQLGFPVKVQSVAAFHEIIVPLLHSTTTDRPLSWDKRTWRFSLTHVRFDEGTAYSSKERP